MILPNPHVAAMDAYALADLSAPPGKPLIALCQNESLRPASPNVADAAAKAIRDQQLYPDPNWTALREEVASVHDIDASSILCGNGSLDLIGCLARAYLKTGDAAVAPAHAYPFFRTATLATGARFDIAPERDLTVDVDALIGAVTSKTRMVFVANPGNPTGTRIPRADLVRLRNTLADDVMLVIDEAYGEFADHLNEPYFDLVNRGNTVVLRTFSKAYGLAGARVGWGLFPPAIAGEVRKLLNPNNVSAVSQVSALAALGDQAYLRETCAMTATLRETLSTQIGALGLEVAHSFTNFALIRFGSLHAAQSADRFLRAEGVFLRPQGGAGLPDCLRATIGVADEMALTVRLLKNWMKSEGLA
ncbi:histidinol-phosphate transaminase [uncultured Roseovarius sp.]|uniref:pyridoxal phosphate-dependent aminotransferase n=1 Tax=uncultured Roseovarius sp. TaxID=293344 RepID=UPI00262E5C52|nr:histidinol-phosphate transaminase [uncultured Roseovarius sp.]